MKRRSKKIFTFVLVIVLLAVLVTLGIGNLPKSINLVSQNTYAFDYDTSWFGNTTTPVSNMSALTMGVDSFEFRITKFALPTSECMKKFNTDQSLRQETFDITGKENLVVPSGDYGIDCLNKPEFTYNEYNEKGLGEEVTIPLSVGESVNINPCMKVTLNKYTYFGSFKNPEATPSAVSNDLTLEIVSHSCFELLTNLDNATFNVGTSQNKTRIYVDNKLYPRLESFMDFKSINRGLVAEQTTIFTNIPYEILDSMGLNAIDVSFDTDLMGDREQEFIGGFYIRQGDTLVKVTDDDRIIQNQKVGLNLETAQVDDVTGTISTHDAEGFGTLEKINFEPSKLSISQRIQDNMTTILVIVCIVLIVIIGAIFYWRRKK